MNQQLRNWYLSSLGITPYIPRDLHARGADADMATGQQAVAEQLVAEPEPIQKRHPRIAVELETAPVPVPEVSAPQKPAEVPEESAAREVRFRLACWQPSDDLLVIDSVNPGEQPAADRVQLLCNILKAVKRFSDNPGQAELIDWPTTGNGVSDEQGARALLSVFLDARIKKRGVCWVLLMGEGASAYIGDSTVEFSVGQLRELSGGAKAILTHSLKTMLNDPSSKAETWRAIRFLADV